MEFPSAAIAAAPSRAANNSCCEASGHATGLDESRGAFDERAPVDASVAAAGASEAVPDPNRRVDDCRACGAPEACVDVFCTSAEAVS
eukprot:SAG31_NODE_863_length_11394_cov_8.226737_10_plen_88_part_00